MTQPNYESPYILTPVEGGKRKKQKSSGGGGGSCFRWFLGCGLLIFLFCCVLPGLGFGALGVLAAVADDNKRTETTTETRPIEDIPTFTLTVDNAVGETHILGDPAAEDLQIEIIRTAAGLSDSDVQKHLDQLEVEITEGDSNEWIISANQDADDDFWSTFVFGEQKIELRITVPAEFAQIFAKTDVGELIVRDVTVTEKLDLTNNIGSIEFWGTLNTGDHRIESNIGAVVVRLASNSSVEIEATSDIGDISVDEGILREEDKIEDTTGGELFGIFGEAEPTAQLAIISNIGAIEIHAQRR